MNNRIHSFEPIIHNHSKILILGSMPGVKALTQNEYYAHKQNQFWRIISALTENDLPTDYSQKLALLSQHGIALWDVLHSCEREGSLDSNILEEVPNDFETIFKTYTNLKCVAFNGGKAFQSYKRSGLLMPEGLTFIPLPSTSPAHTASFEVKLQQWSVLKAYL